MAHRRKSQNKYVGENPPAYILGQNSPRARTVKWGHWDFKTNPQAGDDADLPLFLLGYTGVTKEGHFVDVSIGVLFPLTSEVIGKLRDTIEGDFHAQIDRILKEYLGGP